MNAIPELVSISKILREIFKPAAIFFCAQRCLKFTAKTKLKPHFTKLCSDTSIKRLPAQSQQELKVLTQEGLRRIPRDPVVNIWDNFLGGLREGQSYGLRKWFSTHSLGITISSRLESLSGNAQGIERSNWVRIRALSLSILNELKREIPQWAQQQTSAHPHLPFWSRLASSLQYLSTYDPDDEDVVVSSPVVKEKVNVINIMETSAFRSAVPLNINPPQQPIPIPKAPILETQNTTAIQQPVQLPPPPTQTTTQLHGITEQTPDDRGSLVVDLTESDDEVLVVEYQKMKPQPMTNTLTGTNNRDDADFFISLPRTKKTKQSKLQFFSANKRTKKNK
mmetsp:Transcript_17315/g.20383  ORF Transcript_17315/g.20383 Transcript_17315/m.20383 type:complete len:337 (-) Transcript_17315:93-1103(-)